LEKIKNNVESGRCVAKRGASTEEKVLERSFGGR